MVRDLKSKNDSLSGVISIERTNVLPASPSACYNAVTKRRLGGRYATKLRPGMRGYCQERHKLAPNAAVT